MRVDFIPKPLHWSPFSILILDCADQTKNMNCFVYLTQIIIAVIVNDVRQCETPKDRTGGMQGNPVLKAGLSCNRILSGFTLLQGKMREYQGPEVLDNIDGQRS